jgi:alkanesulfonate monooxygenase SsuD/methylene tetrahydromethanopterin reductase-like flavin-dependent oxidoreductase (luciferase family)
VLALELATLARLHPGRLRAGIGVGELDRLRELGVEPRSPVAAVRDCAGRVRRLLAGEADGDVRLGFPPAEPVPLYLGVAGPRLLELSGAVADGTVLSWVKGTGYVRFARERVGPPPHRLVSLALFSVDGDAARAREAVRAAVAHDYARGPNVFTDADGLSDELRDLLRDGPATLADRLPERWLEELTVSGDPADCARAIRRQLEAGADAVALFPYPVERAEPMLELAAAEILPRLEPATKEA